MASAPRKTIICGEMTYPFDSNAPSCFDDTQASIYAWPSRGGVIILNRADAMDFEFLGLDPLDTPLERLKDQNAEDVLSQRLLLLGEKWWDSEAQYMITLAIEKGATRACEGSFRDL
ncbi:hypothetical protein PVAG01_03843 [Phlyctema vagabunda]|uniref:Uncharacterized protein n=1 Tax=Phlyctema vagabunda TaxID=108571 RepID=A0ABR4PMK1_9HELO